jgi:hypothetical protein
MNDLASPWCVAVATLLVGTVAACGGDVAAKGEAKGPSDVRSTVISHESCDEGGNRVEAMDANGDGKPDVRRVFDKGTSRLTCTVADVDRDGHPDLYEFYGPGGQIRRREASFDETGAISAIDYFEGGLRTRRELDTSGQRKIDTWEYFDSQGKLAKRERDADGDGRVDQWWTWEKDRLVILNDHDGDGKPDPNPVVIAADGKIADGGAPRPPEANPVEGPKPADGVKATEPPSKKDVTPTGTGPTKGKVLRSTKSLGMKGSVR